MILNENTSADEIIQKYIERAKKEIERRTEIKGDSMYAYIATFGCQQNVADSERLLGQLLTIGYKKTDVMENADIIIFNTCAVREHAELKALSKTGQLKHLKSKNSNLLIGLWGCMVAQEHRKEDIRESYPYVDFIAGTNMLHRLPEILCDVLETGRRRYYVDDTPHIIKEGIPTEREDELSAWLPIMYGCDNFCTYCVVPYVRGRERSREPEHILEEAKEIIGKGCKEITLLGQNVNSYGKGLPEDKKMTFAQLLQKICELDGDFTVRFMTSHPKDASDELIDVIAKNSKAARHFHLPMQAGNDEILKRMNRKYTRAEYLALAKKIKERIPDVTLTSDIIVGFPGETEEQFEDTMSMMREICFDSVYAFIFSPRKGTPAEKMEDNVTYDEKNERFTRLCALESEISCMLSEKMVGNTYRVLCTADKDCDEGYYIGHTSGNKTVKFKGEGSLYGKYINVKIEKAVKSQVYGVLCD